MGSEIMRYTELISKKEEIRKEHKILKDWQIEAPYKSGVMVEVIDLKRSYPFSSSSDKNQKVA